MSNHTFVVVFAALLLAACFGVAKAGVLATGTPDEVVAGVSTQPPVLPAAITPPVLPESEAAMAAAARTSPVRVSSFLHKSIWFSGWFRSLSRAAEVASKLPQMTTLIAAVAAAGVGGPLGNRDTQWTILAPTNDAFEDLLDALNITPEQLLANTALLTKVLSYHVIPSAAATSAQLMNGPYPTALQGASVTIKKRRSGSVRIFGATAGNVANVIAPNIRAGKSIIHVIDTVLVPSA